MIHKNILKKNKTNKNIKLKLYTINTLIREHMWNGMDFSIIIKK